jgi:hypothetical protein
LSVIVSSSLKVPSELAENVSALWTRIACNGAVLCLRAAAVDGSTFAWTASANVASNLIPKGDANAALSCHRPLNTLSKNSTGVGCVIAHLLTNLAHASFANSLSGLACAHASAHMLAATKTSACSALTQPITLCHFSFLLCCLALAHARLVDATKSLMQSKAALGFVLALVPPAPSVLAFACRPKLSASKPSR